MRSLTLTPKSRESARIRRFLTAQLRGRAVTAVSFPGCLKYNSGILHESLRLRFAQKECP